MPTLSPTTPNPQTTTGEPTAHPATNSVQPASLPLNLIPNGPFLHQHFTTAYPHPQFLEQISDPTLLDLDVPKYLVYTAWSAGAGIPTEIGNFRYYLCTLLARHHSYRVVYWNGTAATSATTQRYREAYLIFEREFTAALRVLTERLQSGEGYDFSDEGRRQQQQRYRHLVPLERDLTHETFALWPELFDRSMSANDSLLRDISSRTYSLHHVVSRHDDPGRFLQGEQDRLRRQWIDLSDAVDVLDGRCERYTTETELRTQLDELRDKLEWWGMLVVKMRAVFEADVGGVGLRHYDERCRQGLAGEGRMVGWRRVGYELVDAMGCVGWRREVGARLLLEEREWLREWELLRERTEREVLRERRERLASAMRDSARRRERLERARAGMRTAEGRENEPPAVLNGEIVDRQAVNAAGEEWDPEADA